MAKTYLPQDLINQNYFYTISNDYYVIHTNRNCYNNYNTTYCDCINVYPKMDYQQSQTYTCTYQPSTYISYTQFTGDYWYRLDLMNILVIFLVLFIFIFNLPFKIIQRFFGRWLKL